MASQTTSTVLQDPIIEAFHAVRQQLQEQYKGDIHAYAQACQRRVEGLGIVFKGLPVKQIK